MQRFTRPTLALACAIGLLGAPVAAAVDPDKLARHYLSEGWTWVEVTVLGATVRVEAVAGRDRIEEIRDRQTGALIRSESGRSSGRDRLRSGIEVRDRSDRVTRVRDRAEGDDRAQMWDCDDDDDDDDDRGRGWDCDDDDDDDDDRGRGRGRGCDD
jgi:hypothetical protein